MAYYDKIAQQWHTATGYKGGAFKEHVLNAVLLQKLPAIDNCSILELGAGNGYFLPLVLRHFSGQTPASIVVTDSSAELLEVARKNFRLPGAQYQRLDICGAFPFEAHRFDLILAIMVLNEISPRCFNNALQECHRVLSDQGVLLIAVTHPDFVDSLQKKGLLKRIAGNPLTMPGAGSLRLPVVIRSHALYRAGLAGAGFQYGEEELYPTARVLTERPGLRNAGRVPIALVFRCTRSVS